VSFPHDKDVAAARCWGVSNSRGAERILTASTVHAISISYVDVMVLLTRAPASNATISFRRDPKRPNQQMLLGRIITRPISPSIARAVGQ